MKRYLEVVLVGVGIASFLIAINTALYWDATYTIAGLVQGALQGLAAGLIYGKLRFSYLGKFLLHALVSYLLALGFLLVVEHPHLQVDWLKFSLGWVIVFGLVFVWFYWSNHAEAKKINQKLEALK